MSTHTVDWSSPCAQYALHIPGHLAKKGRADRLRRVLTDFEFLAAKLRYKDVQALIDDYDLDADPDLRAVQHALRLSAHILGRDELQLWPQLYGRLMTSPSDGVRTFLERRPDAVWLRPLHATLDQAAAELVRTVETGHENDLRDVVVTPDGTRALTASADHTLKLWNPQAGELLLTLRGHERSVDTAALTPDGRRALSASVDGVVHVWDLRQSWPETTLRVEARIQAVALSADGRYALAGGDDGRIHCWDLDDDARLLARWDAHGDEIHALAVSADGRRALSASADATLKVWDLPGGEPRHTLHGHEGWILAADLTPDGRRALSGAFDGTLRVWDVETGEEIRRIQREITQILSVSISEDGRHGAAAFLEQRIEVWDLERAVLLAALRGHTEFVTAVRLTGDGRQLLSVAEDQTLKIWQIGAVRPAADVPEPEAVTVRTVDVTPDGRRALSVTLDARVRIWDVTRGTILRSFQAHGSYSWSSALTPDGRRLVTASDDRTLKVWDLETGELLRTLTGHEGWVWAVSVTADGRRAVSGSLDRTLRVWDLRDGGELACLRGHDDAVVAVALSDDGRVAASTSYDGTLKIWDLEAGAARETLPDVVSTQGNAVALTRDGRTLAYPSRAGLRIVDAVAGRTRRELDDDPETVRDLALSADARHLAVAHGGGTLEIWDVDAATRLVTFHGDNAINACAVTPCSRVVVVGESSGRVHFLGLEVGREEESRPINVQVGMFDVEHRDEVAAAGDRRLARQPEFG